MEQDSWNSNCLTSPCELALVTRDCWQNQALGGATICCGQFEGEVKEKIEVLFLLFVLALHLNCILISPSLSRKHVFTFDSCHINCIQTTYV